MVIRVEQDGVIHNFPDEATPQMIASALGVSFDGTSDQRSPTRSQIPKENELRNINITKDFLGMTPVGQAVLPIFSGLGKGGQNIASTFTGGYAPTVNMREVFGIRDASKPQEAIEGAAQYSPLIAGGPLGLLGDTLAGAGYASIQTPESPLLGAGVGAGSGLTAGLLNYLSKSTNPIVGALVRSATGGLLGGAVGGKEGAATGATLGFAAPKALDILGYRPQRLAENIVGMISPGEAQARLGAANRLGISLSPGEASGRPDVGALEQNLGRYGEAATERVKVGNERVAEQKAAIRAFKNEIAPGVSDAAYQVRKAAQDYIQGLKDVRAKASKPYYEASEKEQIPQDELDKLLDVPRIKMTVKEVLSDPEFMYKLGGKQPTGAKMIAMIENRIDNLIDKAKKKPYNKERIENLEYAKENLTSDYGDPMVQNVLKEIYDKDPVFHATAQGIDTRSVEFLDAVKKRIDTLAKKTGSSLEGKDKHKADLISDSARMITEVTDKYSPSYQAGRAAHAGMTPLINETESSQLARIADLKDTDLHKVSGMIFDSSMDLRTISTLKKQIMSQNPQAWDQIVLSEVKRLTKKGEQSAPQFYRTLLQNDDQFEKFNLALDHKPEAQQMLTDMRTAFKDIVNLETYRTRAGRAANFMDTARNHYEMIIRGIKESIGTKKEAEALRYLYSPRWQADMQNIMTTKNKESRALQAAAMLSKIAPTIVLTKSLEDQ